MRLILELEPDGPVRGTVAGPDAECQTFYGWLELAAALERARIPEVGDGAAPEQVTLLGEVPVAGDDGSPWNLG